MWNKTRKRLPTKWCNAGTDWRLRLWQTRPNCRGYIVARDVSWAAQTGKHLLRTQNVSDQNQKHFLCPQQMLSARANGETFVSATMCPRSPGPLVKG